MITHRTISFRKGLKWGFLFFLLYIPLVQPLAALKSDIFTSRGYTGDISACMKNQDFMDRNTCIKTVALQKNSLDICNQINENSTDEIEGILGKSLRNSCISELAIQRLDMELCQIAQNTTHYASDHFRDQCIANIAAKKGDASLCDLITTSDDGGTEWRGNCVRWLGGR